MNLNEKFKNFIFILPIILISFYYSIYQFEGQSAVDGGLVLSGLVDFPNNFSNVKSIFYNGWTILHHLTLILFKINFSVDLISTILIFIITIFYTLGIYFLILGFNHSKMFALILSLIVIISKKIIGYSFCNQNWYMLAKVIGLRISNSCHLSRSYNASLSG